MHLKTMLIASKGATPSANTVVKKPMNIIPNNKIIAIPKTIAFSIFHEFEIETP